MQPLINEARHPWQDYERYASDETHPDGKVYHLFRECESVRDLFENITRLASNKRRLRLCPRCHAGGPDTYVTLGPACR